MKEIIKNAAYFVVLAMVLSAFTACGGSETTKSDPVDNGYPPLQSAIAKAEMKNLDGSTFTVEDRKGKILLLNLWATWCKPCIAEMPVLVKMQDDYRDKGFEILGLNTDDEEVELINKFSERMSLNYTIVWANTQMQSDMINVSKFQGIPQTFLVDREGKLRGIFKGASHSEIERMKDLVAKLVEE